MTGYGRGEHLNEQYKFTVEMKSVNHRFCEITVRMSRLYLMLEEKIKKLLQQNVARGKIEIFINIEATGQNQAAVSVDEGLAKAYYQSLLKLQNILALNDNITLNMIARFPNVVQVEEPENDLEAVWSGLKEALDRALAQFVCSRTQEGNRLKQDIAGKLELLQQILSNIISRAPLVEKNYRERLENRLAAVLPNGEFDEARVLQEVAILADKCNIDEEIVRLKSHLEQAAVFLASEEPIGRQFDFLIQEMNREMNTIGSKANDSLIAQEVIQGKSEIEKIREQIQNIE
ncbi:MAG: YicC/YloC family endoribonuclease [bacterium]